MLTKEDDRRFQNDNDEQTGERMKDMIDELWYHAKQPGDNRIRLNTRPDFHTSRYPSTQFLLRNKSDPGDDKNQST